MNEVDVGMSHFALKNANESSWLRKNTAALHLLDQFVHSLKNTD